MCEPERQMDIFDFEEKECQYCKHSRERSEFDIISVGKWAYRYHCMLHSEYVQTAHTCEDYKRGEEE